MVSVASRRRTAWIALIALLAAALLPALTHAVGPARTPMAWMGDVCTVADAHRVAAPVGTGIDPSAPVEHGTHAEHCALCAPSGGAVAPPPGATGWQPRAAPREIRVIVVGAAPRATAAWPAARPRGPPASA